MAERTQAVIKFAVGDYPATKDSRRMELTESARQAWERLYLGELNRPEDTELLTAILERRAPMLLRLAMLFALTDLTLRIDVCHVDAAAAWMRYAVESVRFVFAKLAGEDNTSKVKENAEKIVEYLQQCGEADQSDLHTKLFRGHILACDLDAAISRLLLETPARIELIERPRADGRTGKKRKIYRLKPNREFCENS